MKIFIICTVRTADEDYRQKLMDYVEALEQAGHQVHLPHRDTNQKACGLNICRENANAIESADEVHIFYNPESQGTHFDMGVAFALKKRIKVVENVAYGEGKSYPRMLDEWQNSVQEQSNSVSEAGRPMTTKEALAMFRQAVRSPANFWLEKQLERDPDYVCTCGCCWVCAYRYIEKHLPQDQ